MQKVSDQKILEYIWDKTLNHVASNTYITYMGNQLGTYTEEEAIKNAESFAILWIANLIDEAPLSAWQFRRRVKTLIKTNDLLWRLNRDGRTFIIDSLHLESVVITAVRFWQKAGLPCGYNKDGTASVVIKADGFDLISLCEDCYKLLKEEYPSYV